MAAPTEEKIASFTCNFVKPTNKRRSVGAWRPPNEIHINASSFPDQIPSEVTYYGTLYSFSRINIEHDWRSSQPLGINDNINDNRSGIPSKEQINNRTSMPIETKSNRLQGHEATHGIQHQGGQSNAKKTFNEHRPLDKTGSILIYNRVQSGRSGWMTGV